jgi:Fe-S oxidoreductase
MKTETAYSYIEKCIHGQPPDCVAVCPFHLDIRAFVEKVRRKRWTAAYQIYRDAVTFPAVVSYLCNAFCKNNCVRRHKDDAIDMRLLERAVVQYARRTDPPNYNIPAKNKTVAIVGGGPAGLACAWNLAQKGYPIILFEKTKTIGGRLCRCVPEDILNAEIEKQFQFSQISYAWNTEIKSLSEISANATFVSVLLDVADGSSNDGIFVNVSADTDDPVVQIANGRVAANQIEDFFLRGERTLMWNEKVGLTDFEVSAFETQAVVIPSNLAIGYSESEAAEEAGRCLQCDCEKCRDVCDLLRFFNRLPQKLPDGIYATLHPIPQITSRPDTRLIASCNMCGLCKEVCPVDVDIEALLTAARAEMVEKGDFPKPFHDYWLRDLAMTRANTYIRDAKSKYLFFPGCQLPASDPETAEKFYRMLCGGFGEMSILFACCGAPAHWAGNAALFKNVHDELLGIIQEMNFPTIVIACPTCEKVFAEFFPELTVLSAYQLIASEQFGLRGNREVGHHGMNVAVFDSCSSRGFPATQKYVRQTLCALGYVPKELSYHGMLAQCCSFGGHIYPANPQLAGEMTKTRIMQSELPFVTFCANCKDSFRAAGKETAHILDIVVGKDNPFHVQVPNLGDRIRNRERFLLALKGKIGKGREMDRIVNATRVSIPKNLNEKLNGLLLSDLDVRDVIHYCEETGMKTVLPNGNYSGHKKVGAVTLWVEYSRRNDGFRLEDVYSHRMAIVEGK